MLPLAISFFVTACVYACVGFGGGSTYSALFVLAETDYKILPVLALLCNLIVVSGGTFSFAKAGHVHLKRIWPWIVTSVPAAWLGGYVTISEHVFTALLGGSLLLCGLHMLYASFFQMKQNNEHDASLWIHRFPVFVPLIGGVLGGLAGMVGIGGGIFLAPILHVLRWDKAKAIAATCSIFILVNSTAGLIGQVMKLEKNVLSAAMLEYWVLFPMVFIGGQIGSYMGARRLNQNTVRILTAILTLYVSARLLWR